MNKAARAASTASTLSPPAQLHPVTAAVLLDRWLGVGLGGGGQFKLIEDQEGNRVWFSHLIGSMKSAAMVYLSADGKCGVICADTFSLPRFHLSITA